MEFNCSNVIRWTGVGYHLGDRRGVPSNIWKVSKEVITGQGNARFVDNYQLIKSN